MSRELYLQALRQHKELSEALDRLGDTLDKALTLSVDNEPICKDCHSFTGGRSNKGFCQIKRGDVRSYCPACPYFTKEEK